MVQKTTIKSSSCLHNDPNASCLIKSIEIIVSIRKSNYVVYFCRHVFRSQQGFAEAYLRVRNINQVKKMKQSQNGTSILT